MSTLAKPEKSTTPLIHNLVFGLVGPYGAGSSSLAEDLNRVVADFPNCLVKTIHVATLIENDFRLLMNSEPQSQELTGPERRKSLQRVGTELRKIDLEWVGNAIVAEIYRLGREFEQNGALHGKKLLAFVVDSVKNMNDVKVLRRVYGAEFYLISLHAPHDERWLRMKQYKNWSDKDRVEFEKCDEIDSDEKVYNPSVGDAGQQVSKVVAIADYHIANTQNREQLARHGTRLVNLLFGYGSSQATFHERSMHLAFSAARRSYCLSKQVGAAIVDLGGNVLGIGHNDVPKAGGGLYSSETIDKRCYVIGDCRCTNDTNKQERFEALENEICSGLGLEDKEKLGQIIRSSQFRELTEYCRAVHAEMEAIISVSRNPSRSTVDAIMYVTTYPCHNCTKHILCSGIKKVVYIEPYPKSLAEELHSDAIVFFGRDGEGCSDRLQFLPYEGVAPHMFDDFFSMIGERKDKTGRLIQKTRVEVVDSPFFARELRMRARGGDSSEPTTIGEMQVFNSYIKAVEEERSKQKGKERVDGGQ